MLGIEFRRDAKRPNSEASQMQHVLVTAVTKFLQKSLTVVTVLSFFDVSKLDRDPW